MSIEGNLINQYDLAQNCFVPNAFDLAQNVPNASSCIGYYHGYFGPTLDQILDQIREVVREEIKKALAAPETAELKKQLREIADKL